MENLAILFEIGLHDSSDDSKLQWKAVRMTNTLKRFSSNPSGGLSLRDAIRHHTMQSMVDVALISKATRYKFQNLSVLCDVSLVEAMVELETSERESTMADYDKWYQSVFLHPLYAARHMGFNKNSSVIKPKKTTTTTSDAAPLRIDSSLVISTVLSPRQFEEKPQTRPSTRESLPPPFEVGKCTCTSKRQHFYHLLFEKEELIKSQNLRRQADYNERVRVRKQNETLEDAMKKFRDDQIRSDQKQYRREMLPSVIRSPNDPYLLVKPRVKTNNVNRERAKERKGMEMILSRFM
eukprot:PhF_6_TR14095/c0_g1_i1/m.22524